KYEPQLAEALQTEAARRLEQIALPYGRKLLLPTAIFLMALLGLTLFFVFTPRAWTAVKRTILPWAKAQYTEVEVKPGDVEIPVGQAIEIASIFSGRIPTIPKIQWQESEIGRASCRERVEVSGS